MATLRIETRNPLRSGNGWKGVALLLLIAAVGSALLLVPALRKPPVTESLVNLPAMSNPPPPGSLHIEPPPAAQ
jgi:hypothetical protein